jgi:hypothetical protein
MRVSGRWRPFVTTPAKVTALLFFFVAGSSGQESEKWIEFSPPHGNFTVLVPGVPKKTDEREENSPTGKVSLHFFMVSTDKGFFGVGYVDYPVPPETKKELDAKRDSFLKEVRGKLISESDIKLKGQPGREFRAQSPETGLTFRSRIYIAGQRAYQTVSGATTISADSAEIDRFLNSFNILTIPSAK